MAALAERHYHSDPEAYHHTRLQAYFGPTDDGSLGCPAREALRRAGEPAAATPAVLRGQQAHEGIARYGQHCIERGVRQDKPAGEAIADGYLGEVREIILRFVTVAEWPWQKGVEIIGIEKQLATTLPDGTRFCGTVDVIYRQERERANPFADGDAVWTVIDWKTHVPGYVWDSEPPWQLCEYPWLVQQNYPDALDFRVGIAGMAGWRNWVVKFWPERETETILSGHLDKIGGRIAAMVERMKSDDRCEPNPGPACLSCLHVHACPLRDTETVKQVTGMMGTDALNRYLWHQTQQRAMKGLLNTWLAENGPIELPSGDRWAETPGTPSFEVMDWSGLVALATEADEDLQTPKSRLPGVARLLKPEKEVAQLLYTHPDWHERAAQVIKVRAAGKPRRGLVKSKQTEAEEEAVHDTPGDPGEGGEQDG